MLWAYMGDQNRWNQTAAEGRFDRRCTGRPCLADTSPGPVARVTSCLVDRVADHDICDISEPDGGRLASGQDKVFTDDEIWIL